MNTEIKYKHTQGGGVPGGHNVIYNEGKAPFITPMRECHSIDLLRSDWVVDIGAYVGTYAFYAARHPVFRVEAYEPTPVTFEILDQVKHANLIKHQKAVVGDDSEEIELHISRGIGVTNSIALTNRKDHVVKVPAVNYAEAIQNATVVKLDIEGGEWSIPITDLVHDQVRAIMIDFHPMPKYDWINHAKAIVQHLHAQGFADVITPDWKNGWTRAGSWIRNAPHRHRECDALTLGLVCLGCDMYINSPDFDIALCPQCYDNWLPKHRKGIQKAIVTGRRLAK